MSERPLTPLMAKVLRGMLPRRFGTGMTGNEIGLAAGERWGDVRRIIFPLSALYRRGYVADANRADGLTGTAYRITDAGVEALRAYDDGSSDSPQTAPDDGRPR